MDPLEWPPTLTAQEAAQLTKEMLDVRAELLLPHLVEPCFAKDVRLVPTSFLALDCRPLCPSFPQAFPSACLGLLLDHTRGVSFLNSWQLDSLKLTQEEAMQQAIVNLERHTPRHITAGLLQHFTVPSHRMRMTMHYHLNLLPDARVLVAGFEDNRNSIRMLLPRVVEAMATALKTPVDQLLIIATYERQADPMAPMLAVPCHDLQAIVVAFDIAHRVTRFAPSQQQDGMVSIAPFIMHNAPAGDPSHAAPAMNKHLGQSLGGRVLAPYPGMAEQHALRMGGTTFMPWPMSLPQWSALHQPPAVQDLSQSPSKYPTLPCKTCFRCDAPLLSLFG